MKKFAAVLSFLLSLYGIISFIVGMSKDEQKASFKDYTSLLNAQLDSAFHNGDIIFQTSPSSQSEAIQLATHSPYSHCGIIFKNPKGFVVYEAAETVKETPLFDWIVRNRGGHYAIKRVNAPLLVFPENIERMRLIANEYKGKQYDPFFAWNDDKIYCSELVWKIYKRTFGLSIGKPQRLKSFDLSSAVVKQKMKERYGDNIPLNDTVISPAAIFKSNLLVTVAEK